MNWFTLLLFEIIGAGFCALAGILALVVLADYVLNQLVRTLGLYWDFCMFAVARRKK